MAGDDIKNLLTPHPEVKEHEDDWELYRRSYIGGSEYKEGNYLLRHENEKLSSYKRRVQESTYVNYCAPVIDIYNSYLFRDRPKRDFGVKIKGKPSLEAFNENADLRGRSLAAMFREVSRWASVFGHMGVIVDKPISPAAVSRADELRFGVRPYMVVYTPEDIVNWGYELTYFGPPVLAYLVLREQELVEDVEVYRVWFRDHWEVWEVDKRGKNAEQEPEPVLKDSGENPLGEIPFVPFLNKDMLDDMIGVSDLVDIAPINQRIYRYDSSALEIIERTAFPFLEVPVDPHGPPDQSDVVIGTGNVLERDITDPTGHRWIEPSHQSLQQILAWREQAVNDIREAAKLGDSTSTRRQGAAVYSGAALDIRFQQANSILSAKAEMNEKAEERVLKYVLMWEGIDAEPEVRYPRKFGVRDMVTDLDMAIRAREVIFSPKFDKLLQKSLASRTLTDMGYSRDEVKDVENDIDQQPYVPAPTKLTQVAGGPNGVSVIQTSNKQQQAQASAATGEDLNSDFGGSGQQ